MPPTSKHPATAPVGGPPAASPPPQPQDEAEAGERSEAAAMFPDEVRTITVSTPLEPASAVESMRRASKKGRLAGFREMPGGTRSPGAEAEGLRVSCAVFGAPYDRELVITLTPGAGSGVGAAGVDGSGSVLRFESRLRPALPLATVVVLIVALWPGVWLTDSLLVTYFSWYPRAWWFTPAWYIPLTLLALPVLWKQFRASEASAAREAGAVLLKVEKLVGGVRHRDG